MNDNNNVEKLKKLAEYYNEKGENQLINDIFQSVIKEKQEGKLDNKQLKNFANKVSPFLNTEQRDRLNKLIEQLLEL